MTKLFRIIIVLALCFLPASSQATTTQSNIATVSLTATVAASLTVSVSPATLNFTTNNVSAPLSVTTTWNLASGAQTTLDTVAFFTTATALTGTPSGTISSSGVIGNGNGSCGSNLVIGGVTFANSCSALVFTVPITTNLSGTNTVSYTLQIPALLSAPPGTYSGTLNIQAVAF